MAGLAPGLRPEPLDTAESGDEERFWSRFGQHLKGKVVLSLWCCFVLSVPNLKSLRVRLLNTTVKHPAPALTSDPDRHRPWFTATFSFMLFYDKIYYSCAGIDPAR